MIGLTQNNTVWLCKTKLEKDNLNQLYFSSISSQVSYFLSTVQNILYNVMYVREPVQGEERNFITVELPINQVKKSNYVMFQNSDSSKYYFAFIDRAQYMSPMVTRIYLKSDSFQTYQFDITYQKSFIDRQTPTDYSVANTLSDTPAHGQLVEIAKKEITFNGGYFVFCSTDVTQDNVSLSTPYYLKIGEYSTPGWVLFFSREEYEELAHTLIKIANKGWGDRIIACSYIPFIKDINGLTIERYTTDVLGTINIVTECPPSLLRDQHIFDLPDELFQYGKEKSYPYTIVRVEDMTTGQAIDYSLEKFNGSTPRFELRGTIDDTPTYRFIPIGYEGKEYAFDKALVTKCNTTMPLVNNLYSKYLMNNKDVNNATMLNSFINLGLGIGASVVTGNPIAGVVAGATTFNNISNMVAKESQAATLGNSVTNLHDGAQERLIFPQGIKITILGMDNSHKEMCRNYWKMFGYPVKSLGNINIGRGNYTYNKTEICNIDGYSVPQEELENIKKMYNNGVTIWNNPATMGQY